MGDILRKVLDTGISLHKGPVGEIGGNSLAENFERKEYYTVVLFLTLRTLRF
jgi:hypothetical protein